MVRPDSQIKELAMIRFATDEVRTVAVAAFASLCAIAMFVASVSANATGLVA